MAFAMLIPHSAVVNKQPTEQNSTFMKPHIASPHRFNEEADKCLVELYASVGAIEAFQKINTLQKELGGDFSFHALGGNVSDEMKLACLEYEYLERIGKIDSVLA
jgi:hypothetical protein